MSAGRPLTRSRPLSKAFTGPISRGNLRKPCLRNPNIDWVGKKLSTRTSSIRAWHANGMQRGCSRQDFYRAAMIRLYALDAQRIIAIGAVVAAGVLAIGFWLRGRATAMVELAIAQAGAATPATLARSSPPDFTVTLPQWPRADDIIQAALRAQEGIHVHVKRVTVDVPARSAKELPRADLAFELQGTYPEIRAMLNALRSRFRGLAVHSIEFKHADLRSTPPKPSTATEPSVQTTAVVKLRAYARPEVDAPPPPEVRDSVLR